MARLDRLPPYLFSDIDRAKREALASGRDVVDLGIGDPDRPTPEALLDVMAEAVRDPENHRYPSNQGSAEFREAVSAWLKRRHGVSVDPATQVLALIGSKEGLAHLPLALLEEGDEVLLPDVGYPVYASSTILAGGEPRTYALNDERGFLPDPAEIAGALTERTRLLLCNYPHNPTGAVADAATFASLLDAVRGSGCAVANDAAYLEVVHGDRPAPSLLSVAGSDDRAIEFHSLSKTFNMTGWRIGFAVGHPEVIAALDRVKQNIDSGVFTAVQDTAAFALGDAFETLLSEVLAVYTPRREAVVAALRGAGFEIFPSGAGFYVWARTPTGETSLDFCARVLEDLDMVVTPGRGFGLGGEGWFRISLTAPDDRIAEGARRLGRLA